MSHYRLEKTYGHLLNYAFFAANPIKKIFIKTECEIHKKINQQALVILKNDDYLDAYFYFSDFLPCINEGVVWADHDFRSSGHFYSPEKKRGMFGRNNALNLAEDYYAKAIELYAGNKIEDAMFYLGATAHIIQDMTVPQHANIRLLDSHRRFEEFIKTSYNNYPRYKAFNGGCYLKTPEEFVIINARTAIKIYNRLKDIEDIHKKYYTITKFVLPLAQKTTAGCFLMFYKDTGRRI